MSLAGNIRDREYSVFDLNSEGQPAKRVISLGEQFRPPKDTDSITVEYPSISVEVYRFRSGGVSGSILKSIQVTYTDSTKDNLLSVELL
jgi:hypothetical protein